MTQKFTQKRLQLEAEIEPMSRFNLLIQTCFTQNTPQSSFCSHFWQVERDNGAA